MNDRILLNSCHGSALLSFLISKHVLPPWNSPEKYLYTTLIHVRNATQKSQPEVSVFDSAPISLYPAIRPPIPHPLGDPKATYSESVAITTLFHPSPSHLLYLRAPITARSSARLLVCDSTLPEGPRVSSRKAM
jgi:hypothetical protein